MKVRTKIICGFVAVFVIGLAVGLYGVYSINRIQSMSIEQEGIVEANTSVSDVLVAHYQWRQNLTLSVFTGTEFTGSYDPTGCPLGQWRNSEAALETANDKIKELLTKIDEPHNFIHEEAKLLMEMVERGENAEAETMFLELLMPKANEAISILTDMKEEYSTMLDAKTDEIQTFESRVILIILGLLVLSFLVSLAVAVFIIKSIMNPLRRLAASADLVSEGNFAVNFSHAADDEIGRLTNSLSFLVGTFKQLMGDMGKMASGHRDGNTGEFIDGEKYKGEFQDVAQSVNGMIKDYVSVVDEILEIASHYAEGDFEARLRELPGDKAKANKILDNVSGNLKGVKENVMELVNAALDGDLEKHVDELGFLGGWKDIISGMNRLMEAVRAPLAETQRALMFVSEGNFDAKITGEYKGEFERMSASINKTVEVFSMYISDIASTLNELAADNFDVEVTREYVGSFNEIKVSMNAILNRLNSVMEEIGQAADQVAMGASQISQSSMALAQGASEQAETVSVLNETVEKILSQTVTNADNSTNANELSSGAKNDAELGNDEMGNMLKAMSDINESSQNISKIIKVIEDIAFQTNLLALNAAVEAARAGEHGKGFAVVAEEVRNLAARSQDAAKETTEMIGKSISKVNEGAEIANKTASALSKIVEGIDGVSDIIVKIEASSKEQAEVIGDVNGRVGQISQVTEANSATAEESAAAAQELNSQSELLRTLIGRFKLRGR